MESNIVSLGQNNNLDFIVFTMTFYPSTSHVRFRACMQSLRGFQSRNIKVVVIDSSPDPAVREAMAKTGAIVRLMKSEGKKGAALREGANVAATEVEGVVPSTWLCFQEPEKSDMARHWEDALNECSDADVMLPMRNEEIFKKTYPIEQYHSEKFANLYLDSLARELGKGISIPSLDWHFGPIAFRRKHLRLWTEHEGITYEAQLAPMVHAARLGLVVASAEVPFEASLEMKAEEEGNVAFIEKRLHQINYLDPKIKAVWLEDLTSLQTFQK